MVGVNGSGKTTTTAKLAKIYQQSGKKVMIAAGDTFRAAAIDQLQVWGDRLNIPVIAGKEGGDSAAVAYDAVQAAIARGSDILIIDTAGRLQSRFNLMEELKKVHRVIGKALDGAPHATWIVLDATTGQNALSQAKSFKESVKVNGSILAKLDTSAKGGMAFAIARELDLPIIYAGLGEKPEDLERFNRESFVEGIIGD
jgi:fused signal recognition particle receptor